MLIRADKTTCPRCSRTVERDGPFMCPCGWRGRVDDEDASYFSSDISGFVCGNCTRECELSDDTPVVYDDIPIPFCSDECEAEWLALEDDFGTLIDYGKSFPRNSRQILSI